MANKDITCPKCGKVLTRLLYKVSYTEDGEISSTNMEMFLVNHVFDALCPECCCVLPFKNSEEAQDFLNGLGEV